MTPAFAPQNSPPGSRAERRAGDRTACSRMPRASLPTAVALLLASTAPVTRGANPAQPAPARRLHSTMDGGGGTAVSTHFRLEAALGLTGGIARSASAGIVDGLDFVASLDDPVRARDDTVSRSPGLAAKVRIATLVVNDDDPEGLAFALRAFEATTPAGARVTLDNGWLLYQPPGADPAVDEFTYRVEDAAGNLTVAKVLVQVRAPGLAPSRNLVGLTVLPRGHVRVTFAGIAGRTYRIEWTDSLPASGWATLAQVVADGRGLIEWVDSTEPPPAQRYYRTVGQ